MECADSVYYPTDSICNTMCAHVDKMAHHLTHVTVTVHIFTDQLDLQLFFYKTTMMGDDSAQLEVNTI